MLHHFQPVAPYHLAPSPTPSRIIPLSKSHPPTNRQPPAPVPTDPHTRARLTLIRTRPLLPLLPRPANPPRLAPLQLTRICRIPRPTNQIPDIHGLRILPLPIPPSMNAPRIAAFQRVRRVPRAPQVPDVHRLRVLRTPPPRPAPAADLRVVAVLAVVLFFVVPIINLDIELQVDGRALVDAPQIARVALVRDLLVRQVLAPAGPDVGDDGLVLALVDAAQVAWVALAGDFLVGEVE